jgi:hypothetical protein
MNEIAKEITRKLRALIKIKTKKEFDPDMVELFLGTLSEYDSEDVLEAIKLCAKDETYGIQPSDILKYLKKSDELTEMEINQKANDAYWEFDTKLRECQGKLPKFDDESTQAAFDATLLENDWGEDSEQFSRFFRPAMRRNLKNILTAPENQSRLALQEAQEKKERAALYE